MTPGHRRKKLELVIERALVDEVIAVAQEVGARGYTVLPVLSGMGHRGHRADDLTGVGGNVLLVLVARDEVVERLVTRLQASWGDAIGVLFVGDVEVLRGDKF
jgi:PII-like signaling protein